jgi:hypothetical protein
VGERSAMQEATRVSDEVPQAAGCIVREI